MQSATNNIDYSRLGLDAVESPSKQHLSTTPTTSSKLSIDDGTDENWFIHWLRRFGWWLLALVAALPFAVMAFGALERKSPKDYSLDWLESLNPLNLVLACVSAIAGFAVNILSNHRAIHDALDDIYDLFRNKGERFRKNPIRNTILLVLGAGAICTAVGIGCTAFAWTGIPALNWAATAIYGFVFWATRFFGILGLVNFVKRKWYQEVYILHLSCLKEEIREQVNNAIQMRLSQKNLAFNVSRKQDEMIIATAFRELQKIIDEAEMNQDEWLDNKKVWAARAWFVVEVLLSILTLICILPMFAQKFFDGFPWLSNWLSDAASYLSGLDVGTTIKSASAAVFSFANPALYLKQMFTLKDRLSDACANVKDKLNNPDTSIFKKILILLLIPITLCGVLLSSLGVFNLTLSSAQNGTLFKDWIPTPPEPSSTITPAPTESNISSQNQSALPPAHNSQQSSTAWMTYQYSAGALAGVTNANFVMQEAYSHPKKINSGKACCLYLMSAFPAKLKDEHKNSYILVDNELTYIKPNGTYQKAIIEKADRTFYRLRKAIREINPNKNDKIFLTSQQENKLIISPGLIKKGQIKSVNHRTLSVINESEEKKSDVKTSAATNNWTDDIARYLTNYDVDLSSPSIKKMHKQVTLFGKNPPAAHHNRAPSHFHNRGKSRVIA